MPRSRTLKASELGLHVAELFNHYTLSKVPMMPLTYTLAIRYCWIFFSSECAGYDDGEGEKCCALREERNHLADVEDNQFSTASSHFTASSSQVNVLAKLKFFFSAPDFPSPPCDIDCPANTEMLQRCRTQSPAGNLDQRLTCHPKVSASATRSG